MIVQSTSFINRLRHRATRTDSSTCLINLSNQLDKLPNKLYTSGVELGLAFFVGIVALGTSALTAMLGFGGGVVLLALLLLTVDPVIAIPLHAAIQIVSNGTRVVIRRREVDWPIVGYSSLLLLPAGAAAIALVQAAPAAALQTLIAIGIVAATWIPERSKRPLPAPSRRTWIALSGVIGFLNPLVGATGPLSAPFYRAGTVSRLSFVGTFAGSQTIGHATKIVLFGAAGLMPGDHIAAAAAGIAGVIIGTHLGSRVLDAMSEDRFRQLYLIAITAIAMYLLIDAWQPLGTS